MTTTFPKPRSMTPTPLPTPAPENDVSNNVLRLLLGRRRELLAYIRAIVRDYDVAEDVYQEVCIAVMRRQDEIVAGDALEGYFRKVARHAALAALEKKGRAPSALSGELLETLDRAWSRPATAESTKSEALQQCVQKLPPRSRQLLHYRYDKRLTGKGLAEKIGSTPESAYVALSRIHRALRECVTRAGLAVKNDAGDAALGGGI